MRAVVDNNLIVSGLLWSGAPSRLIDAVRDGRLELVLSPDLYLELEDVLNRDKLAARFEARGMTPAGLPSVISTVAEMVFPESLPLPVTLRDPDNLAVLECAVAAHADAIITGDKRLLVMKEFQAIPILDVQTALERIGLAAE